MNSSPIKDAVQGKGNTVYSCEPNHVAWMKHYVETAFLTGGCLSACIAGRERFPDLKLVRGLVRLNNCVFVDFTHLLENELVELFVNGYGNALVPHWWLETEDGRIVDGSFKQFTDPNGCYQAKTVYRYYPFPEHLKEKLPVGKCPNCGGLIYPHENSNGIHTHCEAEYFSYLTSL